MSRLLHLLACAALLSVPVAAWAQTPEPATAPVPQSHVPPPVLLELRNLERAFDLALANDCAPERCFSKGCLYVNHVAVDLPRNGSLPGLGQGEGPGSVPAQEYLTEASCEFTHEKSVPTRDVRALVRRLEHKLSKGWLKVTVGRQTLEPIAQGLRESPLPPEQRPPAPPPAPPAPEPVKPEPVPPQTWEAEVALRELWVSLLPHFSWMVAVVMLTFSALTLIWATRRLGRESAEEKALAAQLAAGSSPKLAEVADGLSNAAQGETVPALPAGDMADAGFVGAQRQLWSDRIAQAELAKDEGMVVDLLREWLKAGEFAMLAKAILVFGDRLSLAFSKDGELAVRKVEFADFLRSVDEKALPSDEDFFRKLNHHAISSSLLSQEDAEVYRSLREEFGSTGVLRLAESLSPRHGALLFALVPTDVQHDVARIMGPELRQEVAEQLLVSNRISREETAHLFDVLNAAREGRALPPTPKPQGIGDRGREFDAAGALSVLLPLIEADARNGLFSKALDRSGGALPRWHQDILYGDMLFKLPDEVRKDMLLEVDIRGLAGWSSVQNPTWQEGFMQRLAPSMQSAIRANMAFTSREDQLRMARRGHDELVNAVKKQVARGKLSFTEMVV